MTIAAGTRFGRYEIRSKIGEGGMGEVYRARDEKLNRDVAIKVLPAALSQDDGSLPQRKALDYAQQIVQGLAAAHERGK